MKRYIDSLIFDFDGVLVDSGPDIANAANYTLQTLGLPEQDPQVLISYIGGGAEPLVRRMLGDRVDELYDQALATFKARYGEKFFVETRLYPGAREVLAHFAQAGKTMGIATNKVERLTRGILEGLNIAGYFPVIVGPEGVTHRKPHPEAVEHILAHLGTAPEKAVMIGDTAADIQAGRAAGTLTCGVTYGFGAPAEIQAAAPDFVIERLEALRDHLE